MSGSGLTSNDVGRLSSGPHEDRIERAPTPSSSKSPSELFSSAFRSIKKITPNREHIARLAVDRRPSEPYTSTSQSPSSASFPPRAPTAQGVHIQNLSLQDSLEKPLPEPPPQNGPSTPPATASRVQGPSLGTTSGSDVEAANEKTDDRTRTMDSTSSGEGGIHMAHESVLDNTSRGDSGEDRREYLNPRTNGNPSTGPSPNAGQTRTPMASAAVGTTGTSTASAHLSGLMCNVHRTTGREPHPLVGATTTILGDKLYVFGGRILSRSRPAPLTADLYELDLIQRHWTKLETTGDIPPPRYFHSTCALGDTKLVCYGGMSPSPTQGGNAASSDQQPEVTVMSDIYIFDVPSKKWTFVPTQDAPQGRYAHCACILPSSAVFSSDKAPLSALQHNPSSGNPNEGRIGINIDGTGGAELVIVGGQDGANHYIEQISVFNLRSLKWTSTEALGKSCGAYRSVVAPLSPATAAKIGRTGTTAGQRQDVGGISQEAKEPGSSMLVYSNYNFLDVKLELQIRAHNGELTERPMNGSYTPPGLRFPNGGIIDTHFVVSGTYLTSSKQEYALWALDLRSLTWSRVDAGATVFSQGSWNRGVLWNRRNTFVVLGNRKRSLVDDYNHRRINFSNVCMVELEAFGFYDNPRKTAPNSSFVSASSPYTWPGLGLARKAGSTAGGRHHGRAAEELGEKVLAMRELADMDVLCIGGERIPVSSRILARRWGPYFVQLLREGTATQDGGHTVTHRSGSLASSGDTRSSGVTIKASNRSTAESNLSTAVTLTSASNSQPPSSAAGSHSPVDVADINAAPTPRTLPPASRPRCLYLPHTSLTVQALLHFLYTSRLPQPTSPLCTPQILCSLLQLARPYRVDGLLEAIVERLHDLLDSRNAAAVFNATAMAAGGGRGIDGTLNPNFFPSAAGPDGMLGSGPADGGGAHGESNGHDGLAARTAALTINTAVVQGGLPQSDELSASNSISGSEWSSELGDSESGASREVWTGELSSVIGLQKRGLRGLMEGRRMRERTGPTAGSAGAGGYAQARVGLGIAGP